jgi:hypothetical protein
MAFADEGSPLELMSTRRRVFLNLIVAFLIAGSLYDLVRDEEHWPFSQYPMFNGVWRSPTFTWLRLFGVTRDGLELPFDSNRYIAPFDQSRLPKAMGQLLNTPEGTPALQGVLEVVLSRYQELAAEGEHGGPPLTSLRLYELTYTIDPAAANVNRPDSRRLVSEVRAR